MVIIGAGPAGLTAAYELTKFNRWPIVLEKRDIVEGLASTRNYKGFYFDIGGHRFFIKVAEVERMWHGVLGDDFLRRPRLSRIYYKGEFFDYPELVRLGSRVRQTPRVWTCVACTNPLLSGLAMGIRVLSSCI